jgi:DNA repair exonuclease SbcCD ATPase subunit
MKVKSLKITDLRNIEIFEGDFDNWNIIGGNNASGKSTVIDAIFLAIVGKTYTNTEPFRLVKHGKDKALISLTLEGKSRTLVITRQFTAPTDSEANGYDYLRIDDSNGGKLTQKELKTFLSSFTIDPLYISRLKPKDQIDAIKEVAGVDTTKVEEEARSIYEERTIENRELKRLEGVLTGYKDVEMVESVDISELIAEKDKKEEENRKRYDQEIYISTEQSRVNEAKEMIERLSEELAKERENLSIFEKNVEGAKKDLEKMEKHDVAELKEKIGNAESINDKARKYEEKQKVFSETQEQRAKCQDLDISYKEKLGEREAIIKNSKLPDYIDFSKEEGVLVNDVPFSQLNTAEQIKTAIKLASILTPDLRVLHIKDGSLLDPVALEAIKEVIEETDYQVLIERVGEEEVDTIVMREGVKVK